MESRPDKEADVPDDEAELEPREYSSPPCYLPEFEPPAPGPATQPTQSPKPRE